MNCGMECIKYLLFVFNFILALCGLAILAVGIIIKTKSSTLLADQISYNIAVPATILIIVGAIVFIITFFGCCGAIRESHCMIVTFGVLLLTLLVIQVVIGAIIFLTLNGKDIEDEVDRQLHGVINDYFNINRSTQSSVNAIQNVVGCCGYHSYRDYLDNINNTQQIIPYSCCGKTEKEQTCTSDEVIKKGYKGCKKQWYPFLKYLANSLGSLALGIAVVELIGVIFSFCLANSIRNYERRGYKV